MNELEAKIKITEQEKEDLSKKLKEIYPKKKVIKKDKYYGNKKSHLRIREEGNQNILNLKSQHKRKGIEQNKEIEFRILDLKIFEEFLGKIRIEKVAEKEKEGVQYRDEEKIIELFKVKGIGHFIEIEIKEGRSSKEKEKLLIKTFNELGYNSDQFDKNYYLDYLKEDH